MIAIIDYEMGNLRSVQKALEFLGIASIISSDSEVIKASDGIILPGVGAFPDAMDNLRKSGLDKVILDMVEKDIPILGICLGMQLFFEKGTEVRDCEGLGIFKGQIKRIIGSVKVPHMGWNNLNYVKECPLLKGVKEKSYFYFVHSYYASIEEDNILDAYCNYGEQITAVVSKNNVYGTQFHPEKSGDDGMKILKNFGEMIIK